jgi:hypothetical protein
MTIFLRHPVFSKYHAVSLISISLHLKQSTQPASGPAVFADYKTQNLSIIVQFFLDRFTDLLIVQ